MTAVSYVLSLGFIFPLRAINKDILLKVGKHPVRAQHSPGHGGGGGGDEAVNTTDRASSLQRFRSCEGGGDRE